MNLNGKMEHHISDKQKTHFSIENICVIQLVKTNNLNRQSISLGKLTVLQMHILGVHTFIYPCLRLSSIQVCNTAKQYLRRILFDMK